MSLSNLTVTLLTYKMVKLISSNYKNWTYYKDGIIDEKGNIIDKERATAFLKFILNIKKLIILHPLQKIKYSSLPLALALLKENEQFSEFNYDEELLLKLLKEADILTE